MKEQDNPLRRAHQKKLHDFDLIETFLWENGRYFLLDLHKNRLKKSAGNFGFRFPNTGIDTFLREAAESFQEDQKYRLKLVLKSSGKILLFSYPLDMPDTLPVKACFSKKNVSSSDTFLYHKTTKRDLYDEELSRCRREGFFDSIFTNEKGEITEGAITNVVIKRSEEYLTPPVGCGILAGTFRSYLLSKEDFPIKEEVLFKEDLLSCDELFLVNSVRKMLPAQIDTR